MAFSQTLPTVKALEECAEWSRVVKPYIPQLFELPGKIFGAATDPAALVELYKATNPLISGFAISVALGFVFLVVSEINRNYSQVDRCWSLLPTLYNAHFATWTHLHGLPSQRVDLVLLWSIAWSTRLTFNYWRRGGYQRGSEDYRWEIVKSKIHPVVWFLFNVTFISFIQSILLFTMAAPTYVLLLASILDPEPGILDMAAVAIQLLLITSEWFSDQQQWDYHKAKHAYQKTGKVTAGYTKADLDRGFNTTGLWAFSRHPNFAAEQTIWLVLYQWSCLASNSMYSWAGAGAAGLLAIFGGSTPLTEWISTGKYPEYKEYQKQVNKFVPQMTPYKAPAVPPAKEGKAQSGAKKSKKN